MRAAASPRDATLLSVLAYAGLRPQRGARAPLERRARADACSSQRALSLGEDADTKTHQHRTVRLLAPLREDLDGLAPLGGRGNKLVFPGHDGEPWSLPAYQSWRRRAFSARLAAPPASSTRRRTRSGTRFASLLLHEGRSVIYVARQLGHDARLTLSRYGHVIDELDDQPRIDAETAIQAARLVFPLSSPTPANDDARRERRNARKPA